jgi:hypothetical protein
MNRVRFRLRPSRAFRFLGAAFLGWVGAPSNELEGGTGRIHQRWAIG